MKNVNVEIKATGEVVVTTSTGRIIPNVNVTGLREFAVDMMKKGAEKHVAALKAQAERSEAEQKQQPTIKEEKNMNTTVNKKGFDAVTTGGKMFTNIKGIKTGEVRRAVQFTTAKGQDVVIGFAKDRNAFMEAVDGIIKEVSKTTVLKRLAKYEGKDAKYLTKMVKELRPVTMAAGSCSCCGAEVSNSVKEYSNRNYGVTLCRPCQKDFGGKVKAEQQKQQAANESEPQQNQEHEVPGLSFQKDACECGNEKMVEMNMCDTCADKEYYARMDAQMDEWDREMNDGLSDLQEDALPEVFNQESNRETSSEHQSPDSERSEESEQNETEYVNPVNVEFDSNELV